MSPKVNGTSSPVPSSNIFSSSVQFVPILPDGFLDKFDKARAQAGPVGTVQTKGMTGLGVDVGGDHLSLAALADFHDWRKRLAEVDAEEDSEEETAPE
jgi:hypothetical protein